MGTHNLKAELRILLALAWPAVLTQLASMCLTATDVLMAGRLSTDTLAAIGIANSLCIPVQLFFMGILMAINPITAQLYGAGNYDKIGSKTRQGLWMSLFLAVPGILFLNQSTPLLVMLGIPDHLIPLVIGYLKAWSWGLPFLTAFFVIRFFLEGLGHTKPPLVIIAAAVPLNIAANVVFMYGGLGFPAMGAIGVGYATSLVWFFCFVVQVAWVGTHRSYRSYRLLKRTRPRKTELLEILYIGLPNGVSIGMEVSMFALVVLFLGPFGAQAISGHQIAINVASIFYMVPLGISIAISIRVGQAAGRDSLADIRLAGRAGMLLNLIATATLSLITLVFASQLAGLYTVDSDLRQSAAGLLLLAALFQVFDGIQISSVGCLRGLKDTRVPLLTNCFAYWFVGIPVGFYFGRLKGLGAPGFWYGLIAGLIIGATLHSLRLYYLTNHKLAKNCKA